ncbi:nucleotidyl transferase AbiEii/AbiGii toxin family protein [Candidatus Omnitrophota bacterium]
MDKGIRKAQELVLKAFAKEAKGFALAGGTALELFYLNHRFSADLDFFSPKYDTKEIEGLLKAFKKACGKKISLESEFIAPTKAKVRFYAMPVTGSSRALKIDFVEDVQFDKPAIRKVKGVRIYSAANLYLQKISAISGIGSGMDSIGRRVSAGRGQARDVFDVYMLSKKIEPLHAFLKNAPSQYQRGMIHWHRTFSRQGLKLSLLDLDIYDTNFDSRQMIEYFDDEIKQFMKEVVEQ